MLRIMGSFALTKLTADLDVPITGLIPPRKDCITVISRILYRTTDTAHTITALKALGSTTIATRAASSATSITIAADPGTGTASGNLANGDWLCIELNDGRFFLTAMSGLASLTMTVDALPSEVEVGSRVWTFGVPANHTSSQTTSRLDPAKGVQLPALVTALNDWADSAYGIVESINEDEPMMVHSDNATGAGTFELVAAHHVRTSLI